MTGPPGPGAAAGRTEHRRLFFALWPSPAMQQELAAAASAALPGLPAGGREVPARSLHLTLAFLGSVPEPALARVRDAAAEACRAYGALAGSGAAPHALGMTLDSIGHWRRPQVLCALPSERPPGATALAEALRRALTAAGLAPDPMPFRAHVTLARRVRQGPPGAGQLSVTWTFRELSLVESRTGPDGSSYSVIGSWPLCGA
ncbi:MAG: RNA 2',3'-cyclic phosphodiesterase [Steroidobacteraceae bacterium]